MKRGQVSIFIIAGIVFVVAVIVFFAIRGEVGFSPRDSKEVNPNIFLESCLEKKVKETAEIISSQGGYFETSFGLPFKFSDEEEYSSISYLCYNENYYLPCVNQEPMLIEHLKTEIENEIREDVENCFNNFVLSLNDEGYEANGTYEGFEVEFAPKKIKVLIEGIIDKEKAGESSRDEDFEVVIPSRFYDLAVVVQEIVYQEAKYCNFDIVGFMLLYPDSEIEKFRTTDSVTIYRLTNKKSQEEFKFAVRSCVIPPGI